MDGRTKTKSSPEGKSSEFGRLLCFVMLSTTGMAAIGIALLAKPLDRYFADREVIQAQQKRLDELKHLSAQQEELMANLDNPGVLERAAVNNLNYEPAQTAGEKRESLPPVWPELEQALEREETKAPPHRDGWRRIVEQLARRTETQYLLAGLGAALVVVSLTCFYKQR
jgi:hypothetical protein